MLRNIASQSRLYLRETSNEGAYNLWRAAISFIVHQFPAVTEAQQTKLREYSDVLARDPTSQINIEMKSAVEKWWSGEGKKIIADILKKAKEHPEYETAELWPSGAPVAAFLDKLSIQTAQLAKDASIDRLRDFGNTLETLAGVLRAHLGKENAKTRRTKDYRATYAEKLSGMFDAAIAAFEKGMEHRRNLGTHY